MDEEKKSSFLKGCVFENGLYSIEYITYTDKEIAEGILFVDSEPIAEIEFVKKQDSSEKGEESVKTNKSFIYSRFF